MSEQRVNRISGHVVLGLSLFVMFLVVGATVLTMLGKFDPTWLAQAAKRVAGAKDAWSAVAAGEMHRLSGLNEQFALVGESLKRLLPSGEALADALAHAGATTVLQQAAPAPTLAASA